MAPLREHRLVGVEALSTVTTLSQRVRSAHPTDGLFEAADLQWWWAQGPRQTDSVPQLFWFDDIGRPVAAVIATSWSYGIQLDPIILPTAKADLVSFVVERGLDHASASGFPAVQLEVDRTDLPLREVLTSYGFTSEKTGWAETWLVADDRPEISALTGDYRLRSRLDTSPRPHHLSERNGSGVEQRLCQTSLYRPDLDLVVLDSRGDVAAYGLFWFDATTSTGLIEPMRTEDNHQRRGLARHLLTTGIQLLAEAGAERIKICFELSNPASSQLYPSLGFRPVKQTDLFAGSTTTQPRAVPVPQS